MDLSFLDFMNHKKKICIIGLGYVGLPLAAVFAEKFSVIGFDIKEERIEELKNSIDRTGEVDFNTLQKVKQNLLLTAEPEKINDAHCIIVTVPTPVDNNKNPDLIPVIKASEIVGKHMHKDAVIVYESTVYPGVTREICQPILEKESGFKAGTDFNIGYSPERINPGDKEHTIDKITKIVSGDNENTLKLLSDIYGEIITEGIHEASSIEVAEAAKVIENTQRDLNIALVNELAIIFHKMNIDTREVLDAAGTKWNFLKFSPGLVGGHCIGIDPYYLTYKAKDVGYNPEVILSGRKINDSMGEYIAGEAISLTTNKKRTTENIKMGILGITFKEDVPDIRNSRVIDIINSLKEQNVNVKVYDPIADKISVKEEYGFELNDISELKNLDAVIITVAHEKFRGMKMEEIRRLYSENGKKVLLDVKSIFNKEMFDDSFIYWRL